MAHPVKHFMVLSESSCARRAGPHRGQCGATRNRLNRPQQSQAERGPKRSICSADKEDNHHILHNFLPNLYENKPMWQVGSGALRGPGPLPAASGQGRPGWRGVLVPLAVPPFASVVSAARFLWYRLMPVFMRVFQCVGAMQHHDTARDHC